VTVAEFLAGPPDEVKTELIYGEPVVCPRPSDSHQDLVHNLGELLRRWAAHKNAGKVSYDIDMVLDDIKDVVYCPDLLFTTREHEERRREGRLYGAADLCVEVRSPNDKLQALHRKFSDYERHGVAWYWTIDAAQENLVECELVEGVFRTRSEVGPDDWFQPGLFPALELRLAPLREGDLKAAVKGKLKKLM
jgi:Uma2 family endonuclease